MSKRLKICIVSSGLKMGGIERATSNLANGLAAEGQEVTFTAVYNMKKFFTLDKSVRFIEPADFNRGTFSLFKTIFWLRKIIFVEKPDVIIVYNIFYAAVVSAALLFSKHKIYLSERSSPFYVWSPQVRIFDRLIFWLKKPKGIIAQTRIAAEVQQKYYGKDVPIKVIPNAVKSIRLFPEIKREKTILAVGRFGDTCKGFDRLIPAFALLKNQDWRLVFAGGDEDGDYLKKQAEDLGILHRIDFLGRVKAMDEVYARAGIFVIPSRSEGFPNALCEAMAAGLPCVSFDFTAGPADLIEPNINGILVQDGDIPALAEAVDYLILHPEIRNELGSNALKVRERLSMQNINRQVLDFIQQQ